MVSLVCGRRDSSARGWAREGEETLLLRGLPTNRPTQMSTRCGGIADSHQAVGNKSNLECRKPPKSHPPPPPPPPRRPPPRRRPRPRCRRRRRGRTAVMSYNTQYNTHAGRHVNPISHAARAQRALPLPFPWPPPKAGNSSSRPKDVEEASPARRPSSSARLSRSASCRSSSSSAWVL